MKENLPIKAEPLDAPALVLPAGWSPQLSAEQAMAINNYFDGQKAGPIATMPLICKWQDCHYRHGCVLFQLKIDPPPTGKPCPVEMTELQNWMSQYMKELDITEKDVTDMAILREMLSWQLLEKRAQSELAQDPELLRESVVGVDADHEPIMKEGMNPLVLIFEKAAKTKLKHREALIATREAKAKDKSRKQTNLSDLSALIAKKIEERKKRLEGIIEIKPLPKEIETTEEPSLTPFEDPSA